MAVPELSLLEKPRENMENKGGPKALLVEQEIKLAKGLAANSKQMRDKAFKSLKKWFQNPVHFGEEDFMRIWQGLFYTLWMSDKLLIQEECSENIAQLLHLGKTESALLFFKCGLNTLINKWIGIDQLRLDKFLMFIRRFLRQMFMYLKSHSYLLIEEFNKVMVQTILDTSRVLPLGLYLHFCEIFMEELAKVFDSDNEKVVELFLTPFVQHMAVLKDERQINHVMKHIFRHLFRQSDMGIEYHEKFRVWQKLGFPGKSVHDIVKEEVSDEEEDSESSEEGKPSSSQALKTALDARAGHVSVVLPQLQFDPLAIADMLDEHKFVEGSNTKTRKAINKLITEFTLMSKGIYPLGMKPPGVKMIEVTDTSPRRTNRKRGYDATLTQEDCNKVVPKKKLCKVVCKEDESFCGTFRRNSGTWFVYEKKSSDEEAEEKDTKKQKDSAPSENDIADAGPSKKSKKRNHQLAPDEPVTKKPKSEASPKPPKQKSKPSSSKSFVAKKQGPQKRSSATKDTEDFTQETLPLTKLRSAMKNRLSSEAAMFKSPQRSPRTPKSALKKISSTPGSSSKKVNINLQLNKSQDLSEHYSQIKKSPGIPWDASKKPAKPLLKPFIQSPINPFYKRKHNL